MLAKAAAAAGGSAAMSGPDAGRESAPEMVAGVDAKHWRAAPRSALVVAPGAHWQSASALAVAATFAYAVPARQVVMRLQTSAAPARPLLNVDAAHAQMPPTLAYAAPAPHGFTGDTKPALGDESAVTT